MLVSLEKRKEISHAVEDCKGRFAEGAEEIGTLRNNKIFWHSRLKLWGVFGGRKNYWNTFGTIPTKFRSNTRVEINPPREGIEARRQGVIARDDSNRRWLLHRGRMSIRGRGISPEEFFDITNLCPETVHLSNAEEIKCFRVACLDDNYKILQSAIADFVYECERVRVFYEMQSEGAAALQIEHDASVIESGLPEKTGNYIIPPQDQKSIEKFHADIWTALTHTLDGLGITHSNKRVGRCGPDLYTANTRHVLFEIKTEASMSDLQKAIGQLMIYEKVLGKHHTKVLVFPQLFSEKIMDIISQFDVEFITYQRKGRAIAFDDKKIVNLFL